MVEFVLAMVAGIIFGISAISQIVYMVHHKNSIGISKTFVGFLAFGIFCTFLLTLLGENSIWYILERGLGTITFAVIFYLTLKYKNK